MNIPEHIAIIMDGNRRWAKQKTLPIKLGHKNGAEALRKIVEYSKEIGVKYLTVYAFSTENWKRSKEEVEDLMNLLREYLGKIEQDIKGKNIRATIKDISAGGMSLITNEEMQKTQSYKIDLNLEQNLEFSCHFKPIRIKILNDEKYSISGKFSLIKNIDRIALAQYCLKKASEHQNKEK